MSGNGSGRRTSARQGEGEVRKLTPAEQIKVERRARRQARREKQRTANVNRAFKMHAARMAWDREPLSTPGTAGSKVSPSLHVGCSGWFYWHWRNAFYPAGLGTSRWFEHYSKTFETVELNAPFYSWPTIATVHSWTRQAAERDFVYTVKVCELITHIKKFNGTKMLIRDFGHIADLLGARMGCFLFQLPPSFHFSTAKLMRILGQLEPGRRNVIEFRHRSWWNREVTDAFEKTGTIFCSCSGPRLPDELVKTADDVYIRFHGTKQWYRHNYSDAELALWIDRIRASGARRVWAYFNNDRDGHAVANAREFLRQLTASRSGK